MSEEQTKKWYKKLEDNTNSLSEEFGLNDMQSNRFRDFLMMTAKEQYRVGNKSGIAWAFKQIREGTGAKPA